MKHQISFQKASSKASLNTFGNRRRGVRARTIGAFSGALLLLLIFCQTGRRQLVKADTSLGNVAVGTNPFAVAVNPVTNKVYVANIQSDDVTVIDGTNNSTTTVTAGTGPTDVAVNPVTNKAYIANGNSGNVTVITPAPTNAIPLNTVVTPLVGNTTSFNNPTFTLTATSTYSPTAPPPQNIYFQMDTANGAWTKATNTGSTATTVTATATSPLLQHGIHILYFFASDGTDATSTNPLTNGGGKFFDSLAPESSPVIGGINAYLFMVAPAALAANVSVGGRIVATNGNGIRNVIVSLVDASGTTRTARTSTFGYYNFDDVPIGITVISVASKRYTFANPTQVISVSDNVGNADFTAIE